MKRLLAIVMLVGCGAPPRPVTPPPVTLTPATCGTYAYLELGGTRDGDEVGAFDAASHDVATAAAATERGDARAAALAYLACAGRFRAVTGSGHDTAFASATMCYRNASWAFANAGRWAAEGKAALEAAAKDDPAHAAELAQLVASPPSECVPATTPTR
jgi:hypothetical protein